MRASIASDGLSRLADSISRCLTPEGARELVKLRIDRKTQALLDQLADKCTEGRLGPEERAEYQAYVGAIDFLTLLQSRARDLLEKRRQAT